MISLRNVGPGKKGEGLLGNPVSTIEMKVEVGAVAKKNIFEVDLPSGFL